jgi:hypothetical protein
MRRRRRKSPMSALRFIPAVLRRVSSVPGSSERAR